MAKKRSPVVGDQVSATGYHGAFVVSTVYANQSAIVTKIGAPDIRLLVEWKDIDYLDEQDASQAAAREKLPKANTVRLVSSRIRGNG
jgi:hypothetical protein